MKENNAIVLKFFRKDGTVLDISNKIDSDTYFIKQYKVDVIDYDKLYDYADYKLEIKNCEKGRIPSNIQVSTIISQIPEELLYNVYAVKVIFESDEKTIKFFAEENACSMGVMVVRLYSLKKDLDIPKSNENRWPTKKDNLPIRMTQHEFDSLKDYFKV